jgi:hypothetical protein
MVGRSNVTVSLSELGGTEAEPPARINRHRFRKLPMRTPSEDFIGLTSFTEVTRLTAWCLTHDFTKNRDSFPLPHAWSNGSFRIEPAVTAECRKCHRLPKVIAYIV